MQIDPDENIYSPEPINFTFTKFKFEFEACLDPKMQTMTPNGVDSFVDWSLGHKRSNRVTTFQICTN